MSTLGNKSYIKALTDRVEQANNVDEIVIITTQLQEDNDIEDLCKANQLQCFRGSTYDLLDRHYQANKIYKGDYVLKIPSDCPFSDPQIIEEIVTSIKDSKSIDYASNYHPPTFPDGLDVEAVTSEVLEIAWAKAKEKHEREHTFPYIWDNPENFNIFNLANKKGNMFKTHRWTVDYPEDLEFVSKVYSSFDYETSFRFDDILNLLKDQPELSLINSKYNGINWYRNVPGKLKTIF
tara:strand:- start:573 stop:1280 length:708 start_codon:yes stop_codon:yes gene_type:complete